MKSQLKLTVTQRFAPGKCGSGTDQFSSHNRDADFPRRVHKCATKELTEHCLSSTTVVSYEHCLSSTTVVSYEHCLSSTTVVSYDLVVSHTKLLLTVLHLAF